jgi:hypothetical protein
MEEILSLLQRYEVWIYGLLGAIAFLYFQKIISAWRQWQGSVYGLEREIAQRRFSTALTVMVLLVLFIFLEFVIVSFVAPSYPQASTLPTPTMDLLATPTTTLPALVVSAVTSVVTPEVTATFDMLEEVEEGCVPGQVEWIFPQPGEKIESTVELIATVNVPNLGFYKYEFALAGSDIWTTIAAGNQPKVEGVIGFWNTTQLERGDYRLRLVVADNQDQLFPACLVPVEIIKP